MIYVNGHAGCPRSREKEQSGERALLLAREMPFQEAVSNTMCLPCETMLLYVPAQQLH